MGRDKIRYFIYLCGRWRWRPTKAMREQGFGLVTMGKGGPAIDAEGFPAASVADLHAREAIEKAKEADAKRQQKRAAERSEAMERAAERALERGTARSRPVRDPITDAAAC